MLKEQFEVQLKRLRDTFGDYYKPERGLMLWRAFGKESDDVFREAVDICIANCRMAPMHKEIGEAVDQARRICREQTALNKQQNIGQTLDELADKNTSDQAKEFAKQCCDLVKRRLEFTEEQWNQAMELLAQAAARPNNYCLRCHRTGLVLVKDKVGIKYQPDKTKPMVEIKYERLYRCNCQDGHAQPETLSHRSGEIAFAKVRF